MRATRVVAMVVLSLAVLLAIGIIPRVQRRAELAASVRASTTAVPAVPVTTPAVAARTTELTLPGNIQAIQETALYSRVDGYLRRRLVDIGDRVTAGQVLAEIDTPDLDQQLAQARATLAQAEASLAQGRSSLQQAQAALSHNRASMDYSRTNLARWRSLRQQDLVSQQDVDDRQVAFDASRADVEAGQANVEALRASVGASEANVDANRANVRRLHELQAYQRVRAPFAGIITVRYVDEGALITAGSSTSNTPMFKIAQTDVLRIFVNVPQTFMTSITPGLSADILVREFPAQTFGARVVSMAGALDPASRTLLTEVRMPNAGDLLRPGMYADVRFHAHRDHPPLLVPTSALVIRGDGAHVSVVGARDTVSMRRVEIGRDYGTTVEIVRGLSEQDRVIIDPPDGVGDGTRVRPVAPASAKARRP